METVINWYFSLRVEMRKRVDDMVLTFVDTFNMPACEALQQVYDLMHKK